MPTAAVGGGGGGLGGGGLGVVLRGREMGGSDNGHRGRQDVAVARGFRLSIQPVAEGEEPMRWRVRIAPSASTPKSGPAAVADETDAVYLERFYRHTREGIEAAKQWGADEWAEHQWQQKFEKIVATYTKKAAKARKKGAVGPAADYRALLYGALRDKYGVDPRALPPVQPQISLVPDGIAAEVAAPSKSPQSVGERTPEERAEALVQRFSALREELTAPPGSPERTKESQLSPPPESPDPAMVAAKVRAHLAAKRAAATADASAKSRSDALSPFLTPMTWEAAPSYAPPEQPLIAYMAATCGMVTALPIDLELFAAAKAEQERLGAEKAEQERLAAEKSIQERLATEQAVHERLATKKSVQERLAAEQAEQERLTAEQAVQERLAAEQAVQERLAAEQAAQERLAVEQAEHERLATEQAEHERLAAEQAEQERLAAEQAEQERLAGEKAERERVALPWAVALIDSSGHATIPASCCVIEPYAFYRRYDLNSVTIPDSVTHIGDYAFYCTSLQTVEIPGSVKHFGRSTFGLTGLTRLRRAADTSSLSVHAMESTPTKRRLAAQPEPEPEPEPEPKLKPRPKLQLEARSRQAHTAVHVLLGLQALCVYVPRLAMPLLVPFICNEYGFTEMAKARLLGAFFPA
eukprot:COSAG02_NODE_2333_length_9117_cov_5.841428_9_plen_641_part_00